jgi:hypothetical protein
LGAEPPAVSAARRNTAGPSIDSLWDEFDLTDLQVASMADEKMQMEDMEVKEEREEGEEEEVVEREHEDAVSYLLRRIVEEQCRNYRQVFQLWDYRHKKFRHQQQQQHQEHIQQQDKLELLFKQDQYEMEQLQLLREQQQQQMYLEQQTQHLHEQEEQQQQVHLRYQQQEFNKKVTADEEAFAELDQEHSNWILENGDSIQFSDILEDTEAMGVEKERYLVGYQDGLVPSTSTECSEETYQVKSMQYYFLTSVTYGFHWPDSPTNDWSFTVHNA